VERQEVKTGDSMYLPKGVVGGRKTLLVTSLVVGMVIALLAALPAYASLLPGGGVAPNTDATGFPAWYRDNGGVKVRICVDSVNCLGGNPVPNRKLPATIRNGNLPDEAFFAAAEADTTLAQGGRIRWRAVLEGAFGGNGAVKAGRQITFTRMQVVGDNIGVPGGSRLTFQTPYGPMSGTVTDQGTLKTRLESPSGTKANHFLPPVTETRTGFGPNFIKWDAGAPAGFLGNGRTPHTVEFTDGSAVTPFQVGGDASSPAVSRFVVAGQCFRGVC
jgi:hypothetical protein